MEIIAPFSKQDLIKLKEMADGGSAVIIRIALYDTIFETVPDFDAFVERVTHTGESIWIDNKYTPISKLFYFDIEEMPLYVNNNNADVRLIAKWRLTIGK